MMQLLENNAAAMEDRQLVWLIWNKHTLLTNSKQSFSEEFIQTTFTDKRFNHANPIQLIGKDGKTKLRAKHLNLNQIFQLIDSMPMRKAEMTEE